MPVRRAEERITRHQTSHVKEQSMFGAHSGTHANVCRAIRPHCNSEYLRYHRQHDRLPPLPRHRPAGRHLVRPIRPRGRQSRLVELVRRPCLCHHDRALHVCRTHSGRRSVPHRRPCRPGQPRAGTGEGGPGRPGVRQHRRSACSLSCSTRRRSRRRSNFICALELAARSPRDHGPRQTAPTAAGKSPPRGSLIGAAVASTCIIAGGRTAPTTRPARSPAGLRDLRLSISRSLMSTIVPNRIFSARR